MAKLPAGNGLLFIMFWPTFSRQPAARLICAAVPALAAVHFALVGLGITADEALVKSATVSCHPYLCMTTCAIQDMSVNKLSQQPTRWCTLPQTSFHETSQMLIPESVGFLASLPVLSL